METLKFTVKQAEDSASSKKPLWEMIAYAKDRALSLKAEINPQNIEISVSDLLPSADVLVSTNANHHPFPSNPSNVQHLWLLPFFVKIQSLTFRTKSIGFWGSPHANIVSFLTRNYLYAVTAEKEIEVTTIMEKPNPQGGGRDLFRSHYGFLLSSYTDKELFKRPKDFWLQLALETVAVRNQKDEGEFMFSNDIVKGLTQMGHENMIRELLRKRIEIVGH